jgi:acetyl-CoA C-acetyltransferase
MRLGIIGAYQTQFGELWDRSLEDLIKEAGEGALKDGKIKKETVDLLVVGNKLAGKLTGQDHLGSLATGLLGIKAPGIRVEAACASGGLAVHQAVQAILAGEAETVLVIGVEKMTDKNNGAVSEALMGAASETERRAGLSFVGLYALMARAYFEKFSASKKDLAQIAVKNHLQASLNPKAHFRNKITLEQALKGPCVAEPLGLFDCSPISDGAAALVLRKGDKGVAILASELATDSLGLSERQSLVGMKATKEAAKQAYKKVGIKPEEIDLAEVHDCFTIAEAMALEDLGFCQKGQGIKGVRIPINTSGGLKACGHPVGATGVKQIVELATQLRGKAGERQVKGARLGLAQNVGGTGGTVLIHILGEKL